MPCLGLGDPIPSMLIDAETGELATFEYAHLERDEHAMHHAVARYGRDLRFEEDPIAHAMDRLDASKRFLEVDGYSGPTLMLFGRGGEMRLHLVPFVDGEPRELRIASAVDAEGAWPFDGIVYSSEAWLGVAPEQTLGVPEAELLPGNEEFFNADPIGGRTEALTVIALTADGRSRDLVLPFGRTADGIIYGELLDNNDGKGVPRFLAPIWRRWPRRNGRDTEQQEGGPPVA